MLDRCAAWMIRTIRSTGWGVLGQSLATLAALTVFGIASFGLIGAARAHGVTPLGLLVPLVLGIPFLLVARRMNMLVQRLQQATAAHDVEELARLRRLIDGDGPPRNRRERAARRLGDAEALMMQEKWADARELFVRIDLDAILEIARPGTLSELGYVTAHAGQPELGVARLERAIAMADALKDYPAAKRWYLDYRLGVVLSLAGRHAEAVELLERVALDPLGERRHWTEALYFLGRSQEARGAVEEAAEALAAAVEQGAGPFASRARASLAAAMRSPHRGPRVVDEPEEDPAEEDQGRRRTNRGQ